MRSINQFVMVAVAPVGIVMVASCAQAAAGTPTEAEVKAVIAQRSAAPLSNFMFKGIKMAGPRMPSYGEMGASGLPPHRAVVVVRATYTEVTGGDLGRDHVQNFYFFKNDFGEWSAQPAAMPDNYTSDLHKVR